MITLYSTGCPRCTVLKKKLDEKNIEYDLVTDEDEIIKSGISTVPILRVDGKNLIFSEAIEYVNNN